MPMVVCFDAEDGTRRYLHQDRHHWTGMVVDAALFFRAPPYGHEDDSEAEAKRLAIQHSAETRHVSVEQARPDLLPLSPVPQQPGVDLIRFD